MRRPPATSAPRRCCWPTSPACTPCTTAPTACARSPSACTARRARGEARDVDVPRSSTSAYFDTVAVRVPGAGRRDRRARAAPRHQPPPRRRRHGRHRARRDDDALDGRVDVHGVRRRRANRSDGARARSPPALRRTSDILTHPVFRTYHSETQMLRYLRRLADRDLALDRTMIPLGSCTMKLNATTEMMPITWPEFANDAPVRTRRSGRRLRRAVRRARARAVRDHGLRRGVAAAQRGVAGRARGPARDPGVPRRAGARTRATVCLIPESAHGTNAASAVMAGMRVVVVKCDDDGNVDFDDLKAKAHEHAARSRGADGHVPVDPRGVRGEHPRRVRGGARVRRPGVPRRRQPQRARRAGQAGQVRRRRVAPQPAQDVLHPPRRGRAGRRAGRGARAPRPVPVARTSRARPTGRRASCRSRYAVRRAHGRRRPAARNRGRDPHRQLRRRAACGRTTRCSTAGPTGLVAHECILDLRPITQATGVTADDVAKRLIDYGFHAPTHVVPGGGHADGRADGVGGSRRARPLLRRDDRDPRRDPRASKRGSGPSTTARCGTRRTRPPTSSSTTGRTRTRASRPRTRAARCRPRPDKYWPPVSRIDGAYGDRNLMCSCPPLSAYERLERGGLTRMARTATRDLRPGHPFALPPRVRPRAPAPPTTPIVAALARAARAAGHRGRLEHRGRVRCRRCGDDCSRATRRRRWATFVAIEGDGRRAPATQHDLWVWSHGTGEDIELDVAAGGGDGAGAGRDARRRAAVLRLPRQPRPHRVHRRHREPAGGGSVRRRARARRSSPAPAARSCSRRSGCTTSARSTRESQTDQEATIGRTKPDSIELDDKPDTAHISRVVIEEDGEELELYRRSTPYGTVGELGLYFLAFSADPTRFTKMLRAHVRRRRRRRARPPHRLHARR